MIVIWFVLAIAAIMAAVMVVALDNPVHSALSLVVTLACVAGMYALLNAPFLAIVQIAVYAGAIMVLFLFVIMLLNLRREEGALKAPPASITAAIVFGILLTAGLSMAVSSAPERSAAVPDTYQFGSPQGIGQLLFSTYLIPFEVTSLLLTVAMVGAILLARRKF